jgi:hypothetical protein
MRDRVTEICEREFDRLVQAEREAACSLRHSKTVPHIGGVYLEAEHDELMQQVARALAFKARHEETTPYSWSKPLPLKMEDCELLLNNSHNRWKLLGYFGRSLRWNHWHEQHPDFCTFCSGVLDFFCCPPEIKMDSDVRQLFPPKELVGITNPLHWRMPRA